MIRTAFRLPAPRLLAPRLLAATLLALLATAPASAATKRIGITSFSAIEVFGPITVELVPDYRIAAVAEGSADAIDGLSVEVNDERLVIRPALTATRAGRRADTGPVIVRVSGQNVRTVILHGGGRISARGLRGDTVILVLDGAGRVDAAVADPAAAVTIRSTGSGSMTATGRARTLTATMNGAGGVDASALQVRDLTVRSLGSGSGQFMATDSAVVFASGSADVAVAGRARCAVTNTGSGSVDCGPRQRQALPGN